MAAPAPNAAIDTAAPPPPPPPPSTVPAAAAVPDQKVAHPPPPPPVPQPDAAPPPRKRKLEDAGFHNTDYYKIRAVVADLRVRFVQVNTSLKKDLPFLVFKPKFSQRLAGLLEIFGFVQIPSYRTAENLSVNSHVFFL
ncbi:hypothetical protein PR202_gb09289 [Eleusine coracana subsp. coracana]|uniref:Uncharacterized protein n=1 Tax=Eleusine coracana subsp. coracana TaxID=191504 RepID=A0AAV5EHL6_ELECO|nr:hypothetical protein PR202_gb09289 [Eleusine coracana subsp. coracana]